MHNQGCVHSVQGRYGQGWLCGGEVGGWGVSKWSFKGSKARPAREGARLVTRHQEETSSSGV